MSSVAVITTIKFDVLIVGGGIIGMLTARALHQAGYRVAIVEKGKLGGEATWAAGGILSSLCPWQEDQASLTLIREGQLAFATLAKELYDETQIDPEVIQSGMIFLDIEEKDQALRWAKKHRQIIESITQQDLAALEPNIAPEFNTALYLPNVAQVRPPYLVQAVKKSLQLNNIKVYEHLAVEKLVLRANQIQGVIAHQDALYADRVIICSGAWSANLLSGHVTEVPNIKPVRGQMLLYKPPDKLLWHIVLQHGAYLIPRKDGHILCGSTLEDVGFDNSVTQHAAISLHAIAVQICPDLKRHTPQRQWAALRPGTSRATPYICKHPEISGLYLNSGHFRYGIVMSIASAKLLTGLVSNTVQASQLAPYAY